LQAVAVGEPTVPAEQLMPALAAADPTPGVGTYSGLADHESVRAPVKRTGMWRYKPLTEPFAPTPVVSWISAEPLRGRWRRSFRGGA
jgi:hypothetical protein